jgi:hypothetical protein
LDYFKEELVDMTDKEAQTCLLIARLLKPYIPEKKEMYKDYSISTVFFYTCK